MYKANNKDNKTNEEVCSKLQGRLCSCLSMVSTGGKKITPGHGHRQHFSFILFNLVKVFRIFLRGFEHIFTIWIFFYFPISGQIIFLNPH